VDTRNVAINSLKNQLK